MTKRCCPVTVQHTNVLNDLIMTY